MIIGIDNGLTGGIAYLQHGVLRTFPMPIGTFGSKRRVDTERIADLVAVENASCCLERPVGSKSVTAAVSMHDSFARIETVLRIYGVPTKVITPQSWQKFFWTRPKRQKDDPPFDTKLAAKRAAFDIWPGHYWLTSDRCTKPHDGMIDAALIAHYAAQMIFN